MVLLTLKGVTSLSIHALRVTFRSLGGGIQNMAIDQIHGFTQVEGAAHLLGSNRSSDTSALRSKLFSSVQAPQYENFKIARPPHVCAQHC